MALFGSLLGGSAQGSSTSDASQTAQIYFLPTEEDAVPADLLGGYPAGQGLSTINTALPGSAAYTDPTYIAAASGAASSTTGLSSNTLLLIAAAAAAAFLFLKR